MISYLFVNKFSEMWTFASEKCNEVTMNISVLLKIQFFQRGAWTLHKPRQTV